MANLDGTAKQLKALTEAGGVSGYEGEAQAIVRGMLNGIGTLEQDRLGSLVCRLGDSGPKVMLPAHIDEVGFMVSHVEDSGVLRFLPLGGWWDQVLLGSRVRVHTSKGVLPGVIGAKPPHLLPADERSKVLERKAMYVDIGVGSRDEAVAVGVRAGDPVIPEGSFEVMANGKAYLGKAFDDRAAVSLMVDVMRHFANNPHPNILYAVSTVQEEVGLRGAKTAAEVVDPDVCLTLEVDLCGDLPGIEPRESSVKLGGGPSMWLLDARMIPNIRLRDLVFDTAAELGLPLQTSAYTSAGADGGAVHQHRVGVPTVVLGIPSRHVHTAASIIHREDYDRMLQLVIALVGKLDAKTVAGL